MFSMTIVPVLVIADSADHDHIEYRHGLDVVGTTPITLDPDRRRFYLDCRAFRDAELRAT